MISNKTFLQDKHFLCFRVNEGEPNVFDEPILQDLAKAKGKTIAQVESPSHLTIEKTKCV